MLRQAFPRALITSGAALELEKARRPVKALGGDVGALLDDPPWAEIVELTGSQIVDVEQLRLAFHAPEDLLQKETTDLGEFETSSRRRFAADCRSSWKTAEGLAWAGDATSPATRLSTSA